MALAIAVTLAQKHFYGLGYILIAVGGLIGGGIGWVGARKVKMTDMPQMVAIFNGVGGGAVALVALVEFHQTAAEPGRMLLNVSIAIIVFGSDRQHLFAGAWSPSAAARPGSENRIGLARPACRHTYHSPVGYGGDILSAGTAIS